MRRKTKFIYAFILFAFILYILSFFDSESGFGAQKCGKFPRDKDIPTDNVIWQTIHTEEGCVRLLNAYLDTRWGENVVRVNSNGPNLTHMVYCQFWKSNKRLLYVVQATKYQLLISEYNRKRTKIGPFMIVCPVKSLQDDFKYVSVVSQPCDNAENKFKIINNTPPSGKKAKIGVCVKPMSYEQREYGIRFVEWMHIVKILGADKVHYYSRDIHPDLSKVIKRFEYLEYLEMNPFKEPSNIKFEYHSWDLRTAEVNILNDCFYRVRNLYEYIVIIDTDEIIMPKKDKDASWIDFVEKYINQSDKKDFYSIRSVTFPKKEANHFTSVPKYFYILQNVQRSKTYKTSTKPFYQGKSIIVPDNVEAVHNHGAEHCYMKKSSCTVEYVSKKFWQLNHYRDEVRGSVELVTKEDKRVWRYKESLIEAVHLTMRNTSFVP